MLETKEEDKNCGNCEGRSTPTCDYCERSGRNKRGSDHWSLDPEVKK